MTARVLERPVGELPAGRTVRVGSRPPAGEKAVVRPRVRTSRPALGPPAPSTADRSYVRAPNGLPSPLRGVRCRIRPLGRRAGSSAPCLHPRWALEIEPQRPSLPDRLVGWCGGADPREQIRLVFPSAQGALFFGRFGRSGYSRLPERAGGAHLGAAPRSRGRSRGGAPADRPATALRRDRGATVRPLTGRRSTAPSARASNTNAVVAGEVASPRGLEPLFPP